MDEMREKDGKIEEVENALNNSTRQLDKLEKTLESERREKKELSSQIEQLSSKVKMITSENNQLQIDIAKVPIQSNINLYIKSYILFILYNIYVVIFAAINNVCRWRRIIKI